MRSLGIIAGLMSIAVASEEGQEHSLKSNMTHIYGELPGEADSIRKMFSEGMFYGRIRLNSFGFKWEEEIADKKEDHVIGGIGGSVIYKSARLNGFSIGGGLYTTQGYGTLEDEEAALYKAGKGVFSRYDVLTEDTKNLTSLAEAYLDYTNAYVSVKAGRQIFESFLTGSNDTKMIPNTFEGLTFQTSSIPDTAMKMAYLTSQKLRDHSEFHHVLAYGDDPNDPYASYTENDDTAMHKGLMLSALKARGIDDRLVIAEVRNSSFENLSLTMNYTAVPELISSAMVQADYRMMLDGMSIIPALRYMRQFDDGAGAIGGANLKLDTTGYSNPDSLDSALYGARVDVIEDGFKLRFGYTKVADEGDLVAPWRGFPTGGFTRAMAQYNWYANTETYMVQLDYDFNLFTNFKVMSRFAVQDFDDEKTGVQADSNVFTLDLMKGFGGRSDIYLKTRYAHVTGDPLYDQDGTTLLKSDPSYDELRIELNYLF